MQAPAGVAVHRDFVFARINRGGPDFASYFGEALASIDNLVDRSPVGRLRIDGGCLRIADPLQLEDLPREHQRHGPSAVDARIGDRRRGRRSGRASRPMRPSRWRSSRSCRSARATTSSTGWAAASCRTATASSARVTASTRATARCPSTRRRCAPAHGDERAAEILQRSPQNALCYPSLALKGSPQAIRVIRPLAADRTIVEAWSFRVEGAPDVLLERSVTYNRLVVLADVGRRPRRHARLPGHPEGPARRRQRMDQPAPRLRRRRAARRRRATSTAPTRC